MKKILLGMLLCGFVLNNGYCFDEEHKITNEYLDESFGNLEKVIYDNVPYFVDATERADDKRFMYLMSLLAMSHITYNVDTTICNNLKKFAEEFLTSRIPSCWYLSRTVASLLRSGNLDENTLRTICSDLVKFWVNDTCDGVFFELNCGFAICVRGAQKEFLAELIYLNDKSKYTAEFGIK